MAEVEVRRSARRRRTITAYRQDGRIVVLIPARLTKAQEAEAVRDLVAKLERKEARRVRSDDDLLVRAADLNETYFGGRAIPAGVRWVDNQQNRWGSCTPADGTIRISSRLQPMPTWVLDYVLVHELAHLLVPGHGGAFWELVAGYPEAERAKGFLLGWSAAQGRAGDEGGANADPSDVD